MEREMRMGSISYDEPPEVMLPAEDDGLLVMNMTVRRDVRQHSAQLEMSDPAVYVLNKGKFKYIK